MNVRCSGCETVYRVDPEKVPAEGVQARCERCDHVIFVRAEYTATASADSLRAGSADEQGAVGDGLLENVAARDEVEERADSLGFDSPAPAEAARAESSSAQGSTISEFGRDDPDTRARRLATALISDIKAYYPDRWRTGLEQGTLREDLREEIRKSWDEYSSQVGDAMARSTSYFRDALNQILGEGRRLF